VIKSRKINWTWNASGIGEGREEVHTGFWFETLREEDNLENLVVNVKIILKWIF
jgi:hypothetical protein